MTSDEELVADEVLDGETCGGWRVSLLPAWITDRIAPYNAETRATRLAELLASLLVAAPIEALSRAPAGDREAVARDARRYQRLRVIGCAPCDTTQLEGGTVLRFQGLDDILDADLRAIPSRGEFQHLALSSPTEARMREARHGAGLFKRAAELGRTDEAEGPLEYLMRRSYEQGAEDAIARRALSPEQE